MTDAPAVTGDLAHLAMVTGQPPAAPTLADVRATAQAELDGLKCSPEWVKAYMAGEQNARADFQRLTELIARPPPGATMAGGVTLEQQRNEQADYCESVGLSPGVVQQVREGIPETAMTYKQAVGLKKQLMADPAFVDRALKGGQAEREKLLLIDIILSGPITSEKR